MRVKCSVVYPNGRVDNNRVLEAISEQKMYYLLQLVLNTLGWKINSFVVL